jgi:hypothetical protein
MTGLLLVGALSLLLVAVPVAIMVALLGHRPLVAPPPGDLSWLTAAMDSCEAEAKADPDTLYFLVIPLASAAQDDEEWRAKSIMNLGNAVLVRSEDALDGLRSGSLSIHGRQYEFRIRDEASGTIYKWKPFVGVAKVSTSDARDISLFRLQIETFASGEEAVWGSQFTRKSGTCYWVNAIVGKDTHQN